MLSRKVRIRTLLLGVFFTLLFGGLGFRLYWVQVVESSWLLQKAEAMWDARSVLPPHRGSILDRNGEVLAEDGPAYTVAVNPQLIHDHQLESIIVSGLAPILNISESKLYDIVTSKNSQGKFYQQREIHNEGWKIDTAIANEVTAWIDQVRAAEKLYNIGIHLLPGQKRYYPNENLASHVLGYVMLGDTNHDGDAVSGIEAQFDDILRGTSGSINYKKDRLGYELPDSKVTYTPAIDGKNITLTLDEKIQYIMENALQQAYERWQPKSLMAIAVDPQTMEILGMASLPDFNPNKYWNTPNPTDFINHTISSQYEPGSTFKLVTLAATVQEGLFDPDDEYQSGQISVPGNILHDYNGVGWGKITYLEGLIRSSNVAFVKLGYEKLGQEKFEQYIKKFGFGSPTGIDLPSEAKGVVNMRYPVEFATATYGQGRIAVTAIQQTAAYAVIANGGKLIQPQIIKNIIDPVTNKVIQSYQPNIVSQVISPATAKKVGEYLEQVVTAPHGTGKNAAIEGYRVAGKTGTANVVLPGESNYSTSVWLTSFIGYAPVEDPKILVSVIADQPDLEGNFHLGGEVAPVIFKDIVSQSLRYMGVPSTSLENNIIEMEKKLTVPDFSGMSITDVKRQFDDKSRQLQILGSGARVMDQFPDKGTEIGPEQRLYVLTQPIGNIAVPDLTGDSLRDAMEVCSLLNIVCSVSGEGYVISQSLSEKENARSLSLQLQPMREIMQNNLQNEEKAEPE